MASAQTVFEPIEAASLAASSGNAAEVPLVEEAPVGALPWSLRFGKVLSREFNTCYVLCSFALLAFAWPSGDKFRCLFVASALNFGIVQGIKQILWVPRPHTPGVWRWGKGRSSGFPSGHTVPAFVLASLVAHLHPLWGVVWFPMAALIGWSRVRVRAHFAWQVLISAVLGCVIARLVCW
jgi:membrane-associated phospholipid phosphatase